MNEIIIFLTAHWVLSLSFLTILFSIIYLEVNAGSRKTQKISPPQAVQMINKENAKIIDVRDKQAYQAGHLPDATHIPLKDLLEISDKKLELYKNHPIILVCATDHLAGAPTAQLLKKGYSAYSLQGGINAWREHHLPIIK